ncbi:MAG TPA: 4-(cytidine 5'-diphospho)-2-C-methyl-D-erythritol kinase [Bacteroidales bacterium]|nr:4-(cytidine 5'-diphospho)-2-C-methyl-D-erythritol kinase [Bacteroidales bacterium]
MINLRHYCITVILFPNAKINIGLFIVAKREDGYHDIETIFYPVKFHDALEFVTPPGLKSDELIVTGANTGMEDTGSNLVMKAVKKVRELKQFPAVRIHLHKSIPAGAGLGGGSSDASSIIKSINLHFDLGITNDELMQIAGTIGSDCPFFIENVPAFAKGRGEKLQPAGEFLSGYYIALLNPGLHISTKEAYANCKPSSPSISLEEAARLPVNQWKDKIINDFEGFAFSKYPLIGHIKDELYNTGAVFSLMTGSGSSVFGIFNEKQVLPESLKKHLVYEGKL